MIATISTGVTALSVVIATGFILLLLISPVIALAVRGRVWGWRATSGFRVPVAVYCVVVLAAEWAARSSAVLPMLGALLFVPGALGLALLIAFTPRPRPPPGCCAVCGYDLRATPGRCPECGTTPAGGSS